MYLGNTTYLKAIAFVVKRCPNSLGLTGGAHEIDGDANPAAILYEILTNDRWGLGLTTGFVDVESFRAAGQTLATERFGLSMIMDSAGSARDLLAEVLRHVDGVMYTDPVTGKLRVTLARPNYAASDPLLLDADKIQTCRISRPSWADTKNVVKINYVDRANNFMGKVAQAQDLANVQIRGETSDESYDFRGISNGTIAQRVAARELKTVSYPLAVVEIEVNRWAWTLRPGDVFRLTWPPLGIVDMACRITRISTGDLKNGLIRIDAVEDIFGVTFTGYLAPGGTSWVDPVGSPQPLAAKRLLELPYALVVGPDRVVATLGAQGSAATLGYQVWSDNVGGTSFVFQNTTRELTPSALLLSVVDQNATSMLVATAPGLSTIESGSLADLAAGKNVLLLNDELIAWQTIADNGDGTFALGGLVRGVADTTPAVHGPGHRAWFLTEGSGLAANAPYLSDVTVASKLLAFTSAGVESIDSVSAVSLALNSRATRPYVPTAITIAGASYPVLVAATDIAVTWSHRNRLAEWSWGNAGALGSPEPGTTYNLRFYGDDDTLLRTYSGLSGTSQTWTTETADTPGGVRNQRVRIELEAVVAGVVSYQKLNHIVHRSISDPGVGVDLATAVKAVVAKRRRGRATDSGTAE
jgi:hypothetical protein